MADKGGLVGGVIQNLIAGGAAWACGQGTVAGCRAVAPDFVATIGEKAAEALGYGVAILLFLLWLGVWLFWLRPLWALGQRAATGRAKGDRIAVLVCDLDGEDGARAADRVADALMRNLGKAAEVRREPVSFKRAGYGRVEDRDRVAQEAVQKFIKAKRADLAVWGQSDLSQGVLHLVFTTPEDAGAADQKSYRLDETLQLPAAFGDDLGAALAAVAAAAVAPHLNSGRFVADVLAPLADKLADVAPTLRGEAAGAVWQALGDAQTVCGGQLGESRRLIEAVAAYSAALLEYTRERAPLDWATTQNNLGNALQTLGEHESGTARLDEAVAAYSAALLEYTRERAPLDWATTQNNLGNALAILGKRESGTARLEEAVAAYRAALLERTRERVPLDWAMTQNNLGNALATLGERESGTARLDEAVAAYGAALLERTRERVPLDWAMTQNNLGNALTALGKRESGTARLEEAVVAYRAALKEWTRERVPLDWAGTQNNLGNALVALGQHESGTARLDEAVAAYSAALKEWTRERVPLRWAGTQNNLGNALQTLGERESGTARLDEAVAAYRAALEERTRERMPYPWGNTQENLGTVCVTLYDKTGDQTWLDLGLEAARGALEVYEEAGADYDVETCRALIADLEARRRGRGTPLPNPAPSSS